MLIEIDDEKLSILKKINQYDVVPFLIELNDEYYIKLNDLFKIIDEITAELSREQDIMGDYASKVDEHYKKTKDEVNLSDFEKEIIDNLCYWTDGKGYEIEKDCIDKDTLFGIMQEATTELKKNWEDLDDYKHNYKAIDDCESGWSVAYCYRDENERLRSFLEKKGLWEEYARRDKS